jgi:serine/threonine protein kinase
VQATDAVLAGRYRLERIIGRGGVADVYRAEDLTSGELVAVKVLRDVTASDLRRFELEARALERLRDPAIVRLRDVGDDDGSPFLVLDLVAGEPLSHMLERGPLDEDEVTRMGAALASAIAHAHDVGIVHRDVKPGNVLVDSDRSAYLTDFGIARLIGSAALTTTISLTDTGLVIGTAAYLAPEQVRGDSVGPPADVYSLGLVLLEAITGERAFAGPPVAAALARLERQPEIPAMTPWLGSLLSAMLSPEPAQRPSADSVGRALAQRTSGDDRTAMLPVITQPTETIMPGHAGSTPRSTVRNVRRPWLLAMFVLAALVALLLVAVARDSGTSFAPATPSTTTTPVTAAAAPSTSTPTTRPTARTAPSPPAAPKPGPRKGGKQGNGPGDENG